MSTIHILQDRVANQIAAGEVIERPVAVVKELVENSLDAGATRIDIQFRNGGKSYIKIEDNGTGMSPDNALLSLERHATSKIREADDLNTIATFGFRGEALPSIASISRFTMRTRAEGWEYGTELLINGGKLIHNRECGIPVGTTIEIAHLFNSVPARRKFLKTDNTEAAHITHLSRLLGVANPQASFTLTENDRQVFQSPVCPSLIERIREIFGRQLADVLIPVESEEGELRISGFVGRPGVGRSTRQEMVTFVNRRPVDSRTLNYALIESFHTYLPKNRYPIAFLFLDMPSQGVDVNVHPAKREVRFREEGRVRRFVIQSLIDLLREQTRNQVNRLKNSAPGILPESPQKTAHPDRKVTEPVSPSPGSSVSPKNAEQKEPTDPASKAHEMPPANLDQMPHSVKSPLIDPAKKIQKTDTDEGSGDSAGTKSMPKSTQVVPWTFIGFLHNRFAILESRNGLIIFNPAAASERIIYEQLQKHDQESQNPIQKLLFPVSLHLDPLRSATLEEYLDFFATNGFEVAPFGRHFYRLEAIPQWLDPNQCEDFMKNILGLIREKGLKPNQPNLVIELIANLAASRSRYLPDVKSRDTLLALIQRLFQCQNPLTDPAGRPVFEEISQSWLKKRFQRHQ